MNERNGLSEKQFLTALSSKLKQVLNPTFYVGEAGTSFLITTDITNHAQVGIQVKGIGAVEGIDSSIIDFLGFFDTTSVQEPIYGMNLGKSPVLLLGYKRDGNTLLILVSVGETSLLSVEVFRYDGEDNKNHCLSIDKHIIEEEELLTWTYETEFTGETYPNFNLTVYCGDEKIGSGSSGTHIVNANSGSDYIDKVAYSDTAYALKDNITFTINNSVNNARIVGEGGTLPSGETSVDLKLDISESAIAEIASQVEIPLATTEKVGGIKLADGTESFFRSNPNFYKLELRGDNYDQAIVNLTQIQDQIDSLNSISDIHRYSDMNQATIDHPVLGSIVQYIGNTTNDYIHGYFYMRVYEKLIGSLEIGSYWSLNGSLLNAQTLLNAGLTQYNKEHDYLLKVNQIEIFPKLDADATITSETEFNVVNDYCSDVVTYAKLLEWGITLNNLNYQQASADNWKAVIILTSDNSEQPIWTLKNVQPAIHMQSALMYKGVLQHFTDLEDKTFTAQPGDFYTIADRSNQEWFFNGTITGNWEDSWEYMGEIITIPEYTGGNHISVDNYVISDSGLQEELSEGDGISILNNTVSVKYDNNTIKKDGSGNLYVDGELTDTTYSAGTGITIDQNDNNKINCTILGNVKSDWNAASGADSEILNKPILATVATSGSYNDLSNKPNIPAAQVNSDWNSNSGVSEILNKPNLATVATSGSYTDLINTPSIPASLVNSDWNATSGIAEILNKPNLTTVATSGKYSDLTGIPTTTLLGPACMYPSNANPYKEEWERSWVIEGPNISYGRGCYIYPKNHFDNMIICEGAANDSTSEKDERLRILVFPSDKYAADEKIRITIGNDYTNHNVGIVLREDTQTDHFHFLNELISDKYIEIILSSHTFNITIGEVEGTPIILNVRSVDTFSSARTYFIWDGSGWTAGPSTTVVPEIKEFIHPT